MMRELKFKLLTERYADDVFRFARSILGNPDDAADATQDILLKFWNHIDSISLMKSKAWIMKTTRNHCLNMLRSRNRVTMLHIHDHDQGPGQEDSQSAQIHIPDHSTPSPDSMCEGQETMAILQDALQQIPEKMRSSFILHEVNGLKYREIAQLLDIPVNSVKVYILRAKEKLKSILANSSEFQEL